MPKIVEVYHVRVFTKEAEEGNPAGVVLDARGLTRPEKQAIAHHVGYSETAFVLPPQDAGHQRVVEFFTPSDEVPSCGHATIATHYVIATLDKPEEIVTIQKTGAGLQEVRYIQVGQDYRISMTQGPVKPLENIVGKEREDLLAAMGMEPPDVKDGYKTQIAFAGNKKIIVPVIDERLLYALTPDMDALVGLSARLHCPGYLLVTPGQKRDEFESRMIAPAMGLPEGEDPVNGNSNAPLGAYLVLNNLVTFAGDAYHFRTNQGAHLGKPGSVDVRVNLNQGRPETVTIFGDAIVSKREEIDLEKIMG